MAAIDKARTLLKSGDRAGAQRILLAYLKDNPHSIETVLLLAKTTDNEKQKRLCYERALAIAPANLEARSGLERLGGIIPPPTPQPTTFKDKTQNPPKPVVRVKQPEPRPTKVHKPSYTSKAGGTSWTLIFLIVIILIGGLVFVIIFTRTGNTPTSAPSQLVCRCNEDSYNCGDFGIFNSAQACYDYCLSQGKGDIHRLDSDNDGRVCENN